MQNYLRWQQVLRRIAHRRKRPGWGVQILLVLSLCAPLLVGVSTAPAAEPGPLPEGAEAPAVTTSAITLAASSATGPTTPVLDGFNREDEDPLSQFGGWAPNDPRGGCCQDTLEVISQQAGIDNAAMNISYRPLVYAGDTEAFATVAATPIVGKSLTLHLGIRQIGGFSWDGYYVSYINLAGTDVIRLSRVMDNSSSVFLGEGLSEVSAGDKILGRKIGSQIEAWHYHDGAWSLVAAGQDSVLVGGMIGAGNSNIDGRWDDFGGGTFVPPVPIPEEQSIGTCGVGVHAYSRSACRKGVNTLTGAYTTRAVDLSLPGLGIPFTLVRTYTSSDDDFASVLGRGWTYNFATSLTEVTPPPLQKAGAQVLQTSDMELRGDDGQRLLYRRQPDGVSFLSPSGGLSLLSAVPGGYELLRHDHSVYRYDSTGQKLEWMRDRNGQGLSFIYVGSELDKITDSAGRVIDLDYAGGRLTKVTLLPDGRDVTYGYNASGLLESVRDARGFTTVYGYDGAGRLESITDQRTNRIVFNTYDPATGRVKEQLDANDKLTEFAWDEATHTSTMTDARDKERKDVYAGRLLKERINHLQEKTQFEYDGDLNVTKVTDPRANVTLLEYDGRHNLKKRTAPAPFSFVEEWTYTPLNDVDTYKDGRLQVTDYDYTGGNLTSVKEPDPDGPGPLGQPTWTYGREAGTGLLKSITDPRQKTTTFDHYPDGNVKQITTQLGHVTTLCYDNSGRLIGRVDPRGAQDCDPANSHRWSYEYNENDQLEKVTDPLDNVTTLTHDPAGNLETRTDAQNHLTRWTYDKANRPETVTAPDPDPADGNPAPVTKYEYDDVGNLKKVIGAKLPVGRETMYEYDDANRLAKTTAPDNRVWTYDYDENGNLEIVFDANGNATTGDPNDGKTTYGYDELNRLKSIDYSDATPDVTLAYDPNDNRKQMTDGPGPQGTETYDYDFLNRLTKVTRDTNVFSYAYDLLNLTGRTYPGGTSTTYLYEDDERLERVTSGTLQTGYAYYADGSLRTTTLPAPNDHVETRDYDRAGRLTLVEHKKGTSILSSFVIDPNPAGNPSSVVRTGTSLTQTQTYQYDGMDRLEGVCFQAGTCPSGPDPYIRWTYDEVGNRLSETRSGNVTAAYQYNGADELTKTSSSSGDVLFVYDKNGNQKQKGSRLFDYDLANRLKTTTFSNTTTTSAYDGLGKRVQTVGEGTPAAPILKTPCPTAIGTSGTATVSKPTGTQAGDLLVVGLAFEKGIDSAITPPSGWTLIRRTNQSSNVGYATFRKAAGASEPTSYSFTLTNSPKWSIGSCAIAGADASSPIDVHNGASGSSGNPSAPSVTTTGPSRLVLAFYANKKPTTYSNYTAPASERWDAPNNPGGLPSNALAFYVLPAAGASGAKSATPGEAAEWVAQQIAIAPGTPVTKFLWDVNQGLPQLALERDGNDATLRSYSYGAGRISQTAGATTSYFHHDGLGSVVNLTSDTGASQRTLSYEPFGDIRTNTGSGASTVHKFTGEYEDGTGLYHLRARQYDPSTGRFLSRDPVPSMGSAYAYVGNSPTAFVDPSGARGIVPDLHIVCLWCTSEPAEVAHAAFDVGGLVPAFGEVFDLINCAWYGAEGDELNAGLSCGSAIPFAGYAATGVKFGRRFDSALDAAKAGDDVPDAFVVVRGGTKDLPPPGEVFSGAAGRTLDEAASGVPHGQIRVTTARDIRAGGGSVVHAPELTRSGVLNELHVNVCLGRGACPFGPLRPNPVPPSGRIR